MNTESYDQVGSVSVQQAKMPQTDQYLFSFGPTRKCSISYVYFARRL